MSSLAEIEKLYHIALFGKEDEKLAAAKILCGSSLSRGWNIQVWYPKYCHLNKPGANSAWNAMHHIAFDQLLVHCCFRQPNFFDQTWKWIFFLFRIYWHQVEKLFFLQWPIKALSLCWISKWRASCLGERKRWEYDFWFWRLKSICHHTICLRTLLAIKVLETISDFISLHTKCLFK